MIKQRFQFIGISLLISVLLNADNYEDRYYKDKFHIPKGFGLHTDLAYSSYLVELQSSEVDSAIDYDILELTLGSSYSYGKWLWGIYTKILVDEVQSNMYVVSTQAPLNDEVNINKEEFGLYSNYTLKEGDDSSWKFAFSYRYASLDALDSYVSFYNYSSKFKYQTNGLALSLVYAQKLNKYHSWFSHVGLVYSRANVELSEYIGANPQDSFVDTSTTSLGTKMSIGYNYRVENNLFLNFRVDGWKHNFAKLAVTSRVGDTLPKARLKEQSFSSYGGITWRF